MDFLSRRRSRYIDTSPESVRALRYQMLVRAQLLLQQQRRLPLSAARALAHAALVLEEDVRDGIEPDTETVRALLRDR